MYIVHTCHTILLLLKQDHHTCNDTSSKTSQTIIMPCQIKKTIRYLRTAHSTVGHICCLGRWAPPGSLLGSPVPPPMPLQHPQQCLICRRTQIEMDSQAQKIARNGHWSVKISTSTNAHKFHSLLAPSHIFHELWMSFLKHKVSVFGVDLDRKEKAEGQRGASDLLCHFCSYTFHRLVIVFLLHFSDCVFTSASQYKYKEEEACLARALFCSSAFHQLQLFSRNGLATWIFPLNISIGNLNIPRSTSCKWQIVIFSTTVP